MLVISCFFYLCLSGYRLWCWATAFRDGSTHSYHSGPRNDWFGLHIRPDISSWGHIPLKLQVRWFELTASWSQGSSSSLLALQVPLLWCSISESQHRDRVVIGSNCQWRADCHMNLTFQVVLSDIERTSTLGSTDILIDTSKSHQWQEVWIYLWLALCCTG